ncbi:MAG: hypothetical protein Q8N72_03125, partial [Candidatus Omnitrophota bacterium]|nr:hypothetical protein [Candidatus Omnitrophota bacterium]
CHPEVIDRQSIKNPAPLLNVQACGWVGAAASPTVQENFLAQKQKGVTLKSNSFIKHGSPARTRTSDLVVTLNPKLLSEVDYIFTVGFTLRQQVHSL